MLRSSLALDLNLTIEVHGTLRQPNDKQCAKRNRNNNLTKKINNSTAALKEPIHCENGAQFRYSEQSPEFGPICRFNHYRPEFFTKCPRQEKVCNVYRGQRSVYVFDFQTNSTLDWTIPQLHDQRNRFMTRSKSFKNS